MFLDRLRQGPFILCKHPDESFHVLFQDDGDRILHCRECHMCLSLRYYFCNFISAWAAPGHVEEYYEWSGDDQIPCGFSTLGLQNRALTTDIQTDYATLAKGCIFLRILHTPFIEKDSIHSKEPTPSFIRFFQDTVQTELDHLIERGSRESDDLVEKSVGLIAQNALVCLRNMFVVESKRYFDVLVPYVKQFRSRDFLYDSELSHKNMRMNEMIERLLGESEILHKKYGKYCAAFDAVHVAALCFLCRHDLGLVYDLVLDFASKICYGYYYNNNFMNPGRPIYDDPFERQIGEVFTYHVSPEKNTEIYRYVEHFRKGGMELADKFSDEFFKTYWNLKLAIVSEFHPSPKEPHFEWVFPRILFRDYSDYYAFLTALAYYFHETNAGSRTIIEILSGVSGTKASPGVISKCKMIYRLAKTTFSKVKTFHESLIESQLQRKRLKVLQNESFQDIIELFPIGVEDTLLGKRYYWSRDMLKRFFDCHPEFEKELIDAIQWFMKLPLYGPNDPSFEKDYNLDKYRCVKELDWEFETLSKPKPGLPIPFEDIYRCFMKKNNLETSEDSASPELKSENQSETEKTQ